MNRAMWIVAGLILVCAMVRWVGAVEPEGDPTGPPSTIRVDTIDILALVERVACRDLGLSSQKLQRQQDGGVRVVLQNGNQGVRLTIWVCPTVQAAIDRIANYDLRISVRDGVETAPIGHHATIYNHGRGALLVRRYNVLWELTEGAVDKRIQLASMIDDLVLTVWRAQTGEPTSLVADVRDGDFNTLDAIAISGNEDWVDLLRQQMEHKADAPAHGDDTQERRKRELRVVLASFGDDQALQFMRERILSPDEELRADAIRDAAFIRSMSLVPALIVPIAEGSEVLGATGDSPTMSDKAISNALLATEALCRIVVNPPTTRGEVEEQMEAWMKWWSKRDEEAGREADKGS